MQSRMPSPDPCGSGRGLLEAGRARVAPHAEVAPATAIAACVGTWRSPHCAEGASRRGRSGPRGALLVARLVTFLLTVVPRFSSFRRTHPPRRTRPRKELPAKPVKTRFLPACFDGFWEKRPTKGAWRRVRPPGELTRRPRPRPPERWSRAPAGGRRTSARGGHAGPPGDPPWPRQGRRYAPGATRAPGTQGLMRASGPPGGRAKVAALPMDAATFGPPGGRTGPGDPGLSAAAGEALPGPLLAFACPPGGPNVAARPRRRGGRSVENRRERSQKKRSRNFNF